MKGNISILKVSLRAVNPGFPLLFCTYPDAGLSWAADFAGAFVAVLVYVFIMDVSEDRIAPVAAKRKKKRSYLPQTNNE